jgi:hypothetical protein
LDILFILRQDPVVELAIFFIFDPTLHPCYNPVCYKPFLDHRQSRFVFEVFLPRSIPPNPLRTFCLTGHRAFQRPIVRARVLLSLVPVIIYFFALSRIPLPAALASSDITTVALSRLIVLGTIILGLLSGFGAISSLWKFLPFISQSRYVVLIFFFLFYLRV